MKDEIKEILDFKEDADYKKLSVDEIVILENKITNLQEELKETYDTAQEIIGVLKDELQGREEYIKHLEELCDKYEEEHSTTFEYWKQLVKEDYKSRNEKTNTLLDELLERAYIDGEYIMYDYSTSELLEVKQALQGGDSSD